MQQERCWQSMVFEPGMVARGLSQLGRTACGAKQAYLKLDITDTDLDNPEPITHCQHVQTLVLARNRLSTLQPLGQLQHLTSLDASHNELTEVLDFTAATDAGATRRHQLVVLASSPTARTATGPRSSSLLRKADLCYNKIQEVCNLSHHSNLLELTLASNQLQRLGTGLAPLQRLRRLDLRSNDISSCHGLQGLCSLQELALDGNRISSLQPLSGLSGLQVLTAANNSITHLEGVQGLLSLRRLDVSGNQLRRIEVLAACRELTLFTDLHVAANPLVAAQDMRLHVVRLLTQLQHLDGNEVTISDKVDALNMAGAATDGLVRIRRRFFPAGELKDGGGAVPPAAAGLQASQAEEEQSCTDPAAMFEAIDCWARSVPALALQPAASSGGAELPLVVHRPTPSTQPAQHKHIGSSSRRGSSSSISSNRSSSRPDSGGSLHSVMSSRMSAAAQPGGVAAVAARLAAGCCQEAPYRQLQLLRACHSWVLLHVPQPRGCDVEAGADLVTWDVGRGLLGEEEEHQILQKVLLPGYSGTWAECVSQLLVSLLRACHLEAVRLSGFWKAGGWAGSVGPGEKLASHNHAWVAAKVNGRWRLLDPAYALIMAGRDQPLPFFLPPEAFIHTHLPFEPCWQLLPEPVRTQDWWQRPELLLGFAAAGGRLVDGDAVRTCMRLELDREGQALPALKVSIAAPVNPQQHLRICLLDSSHQLLSTWKQVNQTGTAQQAADRNSQCEVDNLVFQQHVLGPAGLLQARVGPDIVQLAVQDLWVAFPWPGTFFVKVEQVTEVPGGLIPGLHIHGLDKPLPLALRQHQDVLRIKVLVPEAPDCSSSLGATAVAGSLQQQQQAESVAGCQAHRQQLLVAAMPQPPPAALLDGACSRTTAAAYARSFQLLSPQPGTILEADRPQRFEVVAPAAAAVAVGSQESGWTVLQRLEGASWATRSAAGSADLAVFAGTGLLPRIETCYIAVQDRSQQLEAADSTIDSTTCSAASHLSPCGWLSVLGLPVRPPVQDLVPLPEPAITPQDFTAAGHCSAAVSLLAALDMDGDGAVSRRDMLLAFRRDRQLADHLKMPARTRAGDGTFDVFLTKFISINSSGLGYVGVSELHAYLQTSGGGASLRPGTGQRCTH